MGPQNFQGQASSFYTGEKEAEKIRRQGEANKYKAAVDAVDPYYSQLFNDLNQNKAKSQNSLTASMIRRGAGRSGVMTKAESNLESEYANLGANLGTEQRAKKTAAEGEWNTANSLLNNLDSEYQGKINQMAAELYTSWKASQPTTSGTTTADDGEMTAQEYASSLLKSGITDWGKIAKLVELDYPGATFSGGPVDTLLRRYFIGEETKYVPKAKTVTKPSIKDAYKPETDVNKDWANVGGQRDLSRGTKGF